MPSTQPTGFVRIRYFGLFANRVRADNLDRCRALIEADPRPQASASALGTSSTRPAPAPRATFTGASRGIPRTVTRRAASMALRRALSWAIGAHALAAFRRPHRTTASSTTRRAASPPTWRRLTPEERERRVLHAELLLSGGTVAKLERFIAAVLQAAAVEIGLHTAP